MYLRLQVLIVKHITRLGQFFSLIIITMWVISQFVAPLQEWIIEKKLLEVISVLLIVEILVRMVDLKETGDSPQTELKANQHEITRLLIKYMEKHLPQKADVIATSGVTMAELLTCFKEKNTIIRLLLQNPDNAINADQANQIVSRIEYFLDATFKNYPAIAIRCYSSQNSLRGVQIDDDIVTVGWYTISDDVFGIVGHINPLIYSYTTTPDGKKLLNMFKSNFDILWNHPTTKNASDVLTQWKSKPKTRVKNQKP